jgi:hypothetical protein
MSTSTAIWIAVGLFFAIGTYLNVQLNAVHKKLDQLFDQFDGLREYLYEIDPQFDDERQASRELDEACEDGRSPVAGIGAIECLRRKGQSGERTLSTGFHSE